MNAEHKHLFLKIMESWNDPSFATRSVLIMKTDGGTFLQLVGGAIPFDEHARSALIRTRVVKLVPNHAGNEEIIPTKYGRAIYQDLLRTREARKKQR